MAISIIPAIIATRAADIERELVPFAEIASRAHIDVSDGEFVPHISWPFEGEEGEQEIKSLSPSTFSLPFRDKIIYEAHVMVQDPASIAPLLVKAGVRALIVHPESYGEMGDLLSDIGAWKEAGAEEVGIALRIDTPLDILKSFEKSMDVIQLMSIEKLGAHGESFDERVLSRTAEIHALYPHIPIAIDGGLTGEHVRELARLGASRFVVGRALLEAEDPRLAYETLIHSVDNESGIADAALH